MSHLLGRAVEGACPICVYLCFYTTSPEVAGNQWSRMPRACVRKYTCFLSICYLQLDFFKLDVFHIYRIDSLVLLERYLLIIHLWVQKTVVLCRDIIGVIAKRQEKVWSQIHHNWNPNTFSVALWPWSCYLISLKILSSFNFSTQGKGIPFWS